jgi:hypothetical protein
MTNEPNSFVPEIELITQLKCRLHHVAGILIISTQFLGWVTNKV